MSTNGKEGEFVAALERAVGKLGRAPLSDAQLGQMELHYRMLTKWNRRLNLTRIVEPKEAAKLHYAESIYGCSFAEGANSVLDVGSGAGFPAVPLAIMNNGLRVTALEPNQKKSVFLKEVKEELGIDNLTVETARVEHLDWSGYSAITSRALDRAEKVYPGLVEGLNAGQELIVFCSDALLESLSRNVPPGVMVESHLIPGSKSRFVGVFRHGGPSPPRR